MIFEQYYQVAALSRSRETIKYIS